LPRVNLTATTILTCQSTSRHTLSGGPLPPVISAIERQCMDSCNRFPSCFRKPILKVYEDYAYERVWCPRCVSSPLPRAGLSDNILVAKFVAPVLKSKDNNSTFDPQPPPVMIPHHVTPLFRPTYSRGHLVQTGKYYLNQVITRRIGYLFVYSCQPFCHFVNCRVSTQVS